MVKIVYISHLLSVYCSGSMKLYYRRENSECITYEISYKC